MKNDAEGMQEESLTETIRTQATTTQKQWVMQSGGSRYLRNLIDYSIKNNLTFEEETVVRAVSA